MPRIDGAKLTAAIDTALLRLRGYIPPGSLRAYVFALVCAGAGGLFEVWLQWLDQNASPLIAYYPAVAFTALLGGIGPAILVAVIGGMTASWAFMPPVYSLVLDRYGDKITLVTFAFVSTLLMLGADHFRRLAKRLEDEEQLRQLAVQELAHRLKTRSPPYRQSSASSCAISPRFATIF